MAGGDGSEECERSMSSLVKDVGRRIAEFEAILVIEMQTWKEKEENARLTSSDVLRRLREGRERAWAVKRGQECLISTWSGWKESTHSSVTRRRMVAKLHGRRRRLCLLSCVDRWWSEVEVAMQICEQQRSMYARKEWKRWREATRLAVRRRKLVRVQQAQVRSKVLVHAWETWTVNVFERKRICQQHVLGKMLRAWKVGIATLRWLVGVGQKGERCCVARTLRAWKAFAQGAPAVGEGRELETCPSFVAASFVTWRDHIRTRRAVTQILCLDPPSADDGVLHRILSDILTGTDTSPSICHLLLFFVLRLRSWIRLLLLDPSFVC
eukprot:759076-Hanusia_phi.AAC.7